jgi:hypothetical protein
MNDLFRPKERLEISNNAGFKIHINCYTKMQKIKLFEICVVKACVMIMKSWACVATHPPKFPCNHCLPLPSHIKIKYVIIIIIGSRSDH